MDHNEFNTAYVPDLIYSNEGWKSDLAIVCDAKGRIVSFSAKEQLNSPVTRLPGRALIPGFINAHSHSFQRVIRGRTEFRSQHSTDSFWTWRELMYSAATRLTADNIYDAARMTFLEMALGGITTVGEFHYLHHEPDGTPYADPNLLAKTVIRAAADVGIRIALLRVAYFRSGFAQPPNPLQRRFIEPDVDRFVANTEGLRAEISAMGTETVWVGVAPHSIRAATFDRISAVTSYAKVHDLPVHMHVAEQPAEIEACRREYGFSPLELLAQNGSLDARFTGVHAIHITDDEIASLSRTGANVCACPATERNLGDGIIPADRLLGAEVSVALGTDSHAQIDMFEEARELEYHLRLQRIQRNVLASGDSRPDALAERLFDCATIAGARSLGFDGGILAGGHPADFFTVDLNDPAIAGAQPDSLLSNLIFAAGRAAVRDLWVGGRQIVADGRHRDQDEIIARFNLLQSALWS